MEPHAVQNNNIVYNIPKEVIKDTMNTESTVADKRKNDKEFSFYTDEMRTLSVYAINEDLTSEIMRISLTGTQVRCLKTKLLVLDINGLLAEIVSPPPKDHKADAIIARRASE